MRVPPRSQASWTRLRVSAENAQTINYKIIITQHPVSVNGLILAYFVDSKFFGTEVRIADSLPAGKTAILRRDLQGMEIQKISIIPTGMVLILVYHLTALA